MKTLIGMVTIGPDTVMRKLAVERAQVYASKYDYEFMRVNVPIFPASTRTPHWEKTLIPKAAPGFDRYLIIDDDVLINHRIAPALPDTTGPDIGLVREPLPGPFATPVEWVGNTGVMLLLRNAVDLLEKSYEMGEYKAIAPGFGDQPAINAVSWAEKRVTRLEWKWNYLIMADWLLKSYKLSYPWTERRTLARLAKMTLTLRLSFAFLPFGKSGVLQKLRECYIVHLTWYRMGAGLIHRFLG